MPCSAWSSATSAAFAALKRTGQVQVRVARDRSTIELCIRQGDGAGAEALAWGVMFVVMPLSGIFYPVSSLPAVLQPIAQMLPTTHAFAALRERALACVKCPNLAAARKNVVFGVGNIDAQLMFVGEAPGADEDVQGEPFVGAAGQLLTKIISATGLSRGQAMAWVVLPQAVKRMIPAFLERAIELMKTTTLVATIAYADLLYAANEISQKTFRPLETFTVAALIYFVVITAFIIIRIIALKSC